MYFRVGLLFFAAFSSPCFAKRSVEYCPSLPLPSKISWQFNDGGDFIVCTAIRMRDNKELFGVYIGNHPSFNPDTSLKPTRGIVGGHQVLWHKVKPLSDNKYLLEALIVLPTGRAEIPLQSHLWILPQHKNDLHFTFQTIANIRYQSNW